MLNKAWLIAAALTTETLAKTVGIRASQHVSEWIPPGKWKITSCNGATMRVVAYSSDGMAVCQGVACAGEGGWQRVLVQARRDQNLVAEMQIGPFVQFGEQERPRVWVEDANATHIRLSQSPLLSAQYAAQMQFTVRKWPWRGVGAGMDVTGGIRSMRESQAPFASQCSLYSHAEFSNHPSNSLIVQELQSTEWIIPKWTRNHEWWLGPLEPNTTYFIIPFRTLDRKPEHVHHGLLATTKKFGSMCNFSPVDACPDIRHAVPLPDVYKDQLQAVYNSLAPTIVAMQHQVNCTDDHCNECFTRWRRWQCSMFVPRCTDEEDESWWDNDYTHSLRHGLPLYISNKIPGLKVGAWRQILPCIALCNDVEECNKYYPGISCQKQASILAMMHGKAPACNRVGRVGDGGWWMVRGVDDDQDSGQDKSEKQGIMVDLKNIARALFGIRKPVVRTYEDPFGPLDVA